MVASSGRCWPGVLLALLVGAAAGGAGSYFMAPPAEIAVAAEADAAQQAREARYRQLEARERFTRAQLDTADGELVVERAARHEMETALRGAQEELGRVRERLAFYEQLLPPGPVGALDIRALDIERQGASLRYRLLLMRNGKVGAPFEGRLRFTATGVLRGRSATVVLEPLRARAEGEPVEPSDASAAAATNGEPDMLALRFEQYARAQGLLAVPPGFVVESVSMEVLEGSTIRATRTVGLEL